MKKLVAMVAAVGLIGAAHADSCASSFSGFIAGAQVGGTSATSNYEVTNIGLPAAGNGSNLKTTPSGQSFLGGIFAGYGMGVGSCAYVGAEAYGNLANNSVTIAEVKSANTVGNFKATNDSNFGAKVRFGYTVSPQAMIFVGLGVEYASWKFKSENSGGGAAFNGTLSKAKTSWNFAPSLGAEMFLTKNLFTRIEGTYVVGTSAKFPDNNQPGLGKDDKVTLNQRRLAIGLGYKF